MSKDDTRDKWKKKRIKIVSGITAAAVVAAGTGLTIATYRNGEFQPDRYVNERQKKDNQIVFPGQDVAASDDSDPDDSEMWQNSDSAKDNIKPENTEEAPMLFQTKKVADTTAAQDESQSDTDGKTSDDEIYSSKEDKNNSKKNNDSGKTVTDNTGGDKPGGGPGNGKNPGDSSKPGKNNKPGDSGKPGGGDKPGNDNKPGDDSKPGGDDKPGDDNKPGGDDKPGSDDKPAQDTTDVDTTVPSLPKDDAVIPADPYPGDDKIDVSTDEEYKKYSLNIIGIQNDDDKVNSLYMGEHLNDQRVLCSVLVYVYVDGNPKYRLTELGDNFKLGDYPAKVTDDTVELTFYYRPNDKYEWIKGTYEYQIEYSGKLLLKGDTDGKYVEQCLVPKQDKTVSFLKYYGDMRDTSKDVADRLFLGWTDTENGTKITPAYTYEGTGAKVLYPVFSDIAAGSTVTWVNDPILINGITHYIYMQELTGYPSDTDTLDIQEGIQEVSLPVDIDWNTWELKVPTYSKVKIPASMLLLGGSCGDDKQADSYTFKVLDSYEVAENNVTYSSYDGVLYNKDKTSLYAIPQNKQVVNIPASVQNINFSYINSITELHFNSKKPVSVDFGALSGVKIYVPAKAYIKYLSAWGKDPGGNGNELLPDDGQSQQFVEDDQAIYSADGKTLISVKSSVDGVYVVRAGVEKIASGALSNCGELDIMILPDSVTELEAGSLSDNPPGKVVFLGESAPRITDGTFDADTTLQIKLSAKSAYESSWDMSLVSDNRICYRSFRYVSEDGFEYLDEEACDNDSAGAVLIKAAGDITTFDADTVPNASWKMIASRAFADCSSLRLVELPESLNYIGREAFAGCAGLQGIISYAKDSMTVAAAAFDGADSLRFAAFDAAELDLYDYCGSAAIYAPANGSGYTKADRFSPYYFLEDESEKGASGVLLYGQASDSDGEETEGCYVLGATTDVAGEIKLRGDTLEIAGNVFANCKNEFTVPALDSVIAIGGSAFSNSGISGEIDISESCIYVGNAAFSGCGNITGAVIDGSGLSKLVYVGPLGDNLFMGCTGLTSVVFKGTGYYDIGSSAFMGCTSLTSVDIAPEAGIAQVLYGAFSSTAISELTLPSSVTGIAYGAFDSCSNLKRLNISSVTPPELLVYCPGFEFSFGEGTPDEDWITVPEGCEQAYVDEWKYAMSGWTSVDSGSLTDEEIAAYEKLVRRYLGLPDAPEIKPEEDNEATPTDAARVVR